MARMKFLCDAERCIECNACVTACKNENEVPWGINRRRVVTINDGKPGERSISVACMHCSDAPCLYAQKCALPKLCSQEMVTRSPILTANVLYRAGSVQALGAGDVHIPVKVAADQPLPIKKAPPHLFLDGVEHFAPP